MPEEQRRWSDLRIEIIIGNLLRIGVMISAAVVAAGAVLYLLRHGGERPIYRVFRGEPADLRSIGGILSAVASLQGRALIQFGLLLLILTPVARVAFSVFGFAMERDRTYIVVTLIVLGLLCYSLAGGS